MISVLVTPGGAAAGLLSRVLSRRFEVLSILKNGIRLPDIAPEILLYESALPPECDGDAIYAVGSLPPGTVPEISLGPRSVAVICSDNADGLAFAARHHLKTLTYGLSSRDTLTLSSVTPESAVVSLQRSIITLGGAVLEPAEFPVHLRNPDDRNGLLLCAAVLLLCGEEEMLDKMEL